MAPSSTTRGYYYGGAYPHIEPSSGYLTSQCYMYPVLQSVGDNSPHTLYLYMLPHGTNHQQSSFAMVGPSGLIIIFLAASYIWSLFSWHRRTRGLPLPPGPKPLPLIGNLFDVPVFKMWEGFRDLTDKYGEESGSIQSVQLTEHTNIFPDIMPLTTSLVISESDFDSIIPMDHDAWLAPYNPQLKHFRPNFSSRDEAIAWNKDRKIKSLRAKDPKRFHVKCADTETGEIIGYAVWEINDKPEPYGEPTKASWHPEGSEEREFAERFINGLWSFIGKRVSRPHMGIAVSLMACLYSVCC